MVDYQEILEKKIIANKLISKYSHKYPYLKDEIQGTAYLGLTIAVRKIQDVGIDHDNLDAYIGSVIKGRIYDCIRKSKIISVPRNEPAHVVYSLETDDFRNDTNHPSILENMYDLQIKDLYQHYKLTDFEIKIINLKLQGYNDTEIGRELNSARSNISRFIQEIKRKIIMSKRSFVMLAHKYTAKSMISGWLMSEKLDGQRCFWDGGISRGLLKDRIPWANTNKDGRYQNKQISTGLWSRYGNVIHAPDWWLDLLPRIPLDGELYIGRNSRQELMEAVKPLNPNSSKWKVVRYHAFDMVPLDKIFESGRIDETNFKINMEGCINWARSQGLEYNPKANTQYQDSYVIMKDKIQQNEAITIVPQLRLPFSTDDAIKVLNDELEKITEEGGEGVMVRNPIAKWVPERVHTLLKVKKLDDDEGTVVGYITGRKTDLGSRLLGKMGALILDYKGQRLELSGFTDEERELSSYDATRWAEEHPESECPDWIDSYHFPRGTKVTFHYRGKSRAGIPNEARYWRIRNAYTKI